MKHKYFFIALALLFSLQAEAQVKQTDHINQSWVAYFNQSRLSNRWGVWADFHLRTKEEFFNNFSTSVARLGLTYYLTDHTKITLGYAYISHYPGSNHANITRPEHRIWQQLQWGARYPRLRIGQYIRLEERFQRNVLNNDALADGYFETMRLRHNFQLNIPLSKKAFAPHTFSFILNNELHINFGKNIVYNYFDHNRFFIGLQYHTNAHDNIRVGYMNMFQQLASGNKYRNIHTIRVIYTQALDFRKKK